MIGNLPSQSDKDEDSRFLLLALGEGISDYIQGAAHARNSGDVGDLTKDLLDFDTPVQNFAAGGEVSLKSGLGVTEENPINFPFDDPSGDPNVVQVGTVKPISAILDGPGSDDEGIDAGVNTVEGTLNALASLAINAVTGIPGPVTAFGRITGLTTPVDTTELDARAKLNYFESQAAAEEAAVTEAEETQSGGAEVGVDAQAASDTAGEVGSSVGPDASGDTSSTADDDGVAGGTSDGPGDSGVGDSGDDGTGEWKRGGVIKGYQEGDLVEDQQADTQLDGLGLGPLGVINDPDGTTGVADDLDMDLPVGSYVLNAEAVKLAGVVSVNKMIKEAIDLAIEDGVDLPAEIKTAEKIPLKISKGEGAIPEAIVDYIGLKKLENMNNRGLKVRKQREAEEAPVEMAAAPSPQQDLLAQIQPVA